MRMPLQLYGQNLKSFFKKTLGILKLLLTIFGINLEKTLSIN